MPEKVLRRDVSIGSVGWMVWILGVFLSACLALFILGTWKWPLVGDASIIHYAAFLMSHGFAPYRQIIDMNMPGCYLVEWLIIHTFGGGSLSWRIFDFALMAVSGAAMIVIAKPYNWFSGFAAAVLLTLIHGQDGVAFSGERDLIIAALLAWAYAFLFLALRLNARRRSMSWMIFASGVVAGIAATMKPLAIPVGPILLVLLMLRLMRLRRPYIRPLLYGFAGFLLPCLVVYIYLMQVHAAGAFVSTMFGLARYYNGLYRKPLEFLLLHSVSPHRSAGCALAGYCCGSETVELGTMDAGRRRASRTDLLLRSGERIPLLSLSAPAVCSGADGHRFRRRSQPAGAALLFGGGNRLCSVFSGSALRL